jgi:hypothetical protein
MPLASIIGIMKKAYWTAKAFTFSAFSAKKVLLCSSFSSVLPGNFKRFCQKGVCCLRLATNG